VVGRHLVEPRPAVHLLQVTKGGEPLDQRGEELPLPPVARRFEVLADGFVPARQRDDDAVRLSVHHAIVMAPMHAARIDHHREAIRPRMGQRGAEQHLPHRFDRHDEARERGDPPGPRACGVDDDGSADVRATGESHARRAPVADGNALDFVAHVLDSGRRRRCSKPEQDFARSRIAVLWSEDAKDDVVEHQIRSHGADVVSR